MKVDSRVPLNRDVLKCHADEDILVLLSEEVLLLVKTSRMELVRVVLLLLPKLPIPACQVVRSMVVQFYLVLLEEGGPIEAKVVRSVDS